MPNCFRLARKDDPTKEPVNFIIIDDEVCKLLNIEPHPVHYLDGWYDTIGWGIAVMGHKLGSQELRDYVASMPHQGKLAEILAYLEEHYESDAWYAPKRLTFWNPTLWMKSRD